MSVDCPDILIEFDGDRRVGIPGDVVRVVGLWLDPDDRDEDRSLLEAFFMDLVGEPVSVLWEDEIVDPMEVCRER